MESSAILREGLRAALKVFFDFIFCPDRFFVFSSRFEKRRHEDHLVSIARQRDSRMGYWGHHLMGETPESGESAGPIIDRPHAAACGLSDAEISFEVSVATKIFLVRSNVYYAWNSRFDKQI